MCLQIHMITFDFTCVSRLSYLTAFLLWASKCTLKSNDEMDILALFLTLDGDRASWSHFCVPFTTNFLLCLPVRLTFQVIDLYFPVMEFPFYSFLNDCSPLLRLYVCFLLLYIFSLNPRLRSQ